VEELSCIRPKAALNATAAANIYFDSKWSRLHLNSRGGMMSLLKFGNVQTQASIQQTATMVLETIQGLLGLSGSSGKIKVRPLPTYDIETSVEKSCRTLKHLIKANHATKAIIGRNEVPNNVDVVGSSNCSDRTLF